MTSNSPHIAAIIVAAGEGRRLPGDKPKAYRQLAGKPIARYSLELLHGFPEIKTLVFVYHPNHEALAESLCAAYPETILVPGGSERKDSVRHGLEALQKKGVDQVLIHDAARPFVSKQLIGRLIECLKDHPAVLPATPLADTIKRLDASHTIAETVPREALRAAQTPQAFHYPMILDLHWQYRNEAVTDDCSLAELAGIPVIVIAGEATNFKITLPEDLQEAERSMNDTIIRTGMGFDVHALVEHDPALSQPYRNIKLCGVDVPSDLRLEGHSDGDVGLHALTDAIFGALACGDLGEHFPPGDPRWRGADSSRFLLESWRILHEKRAVLLNLDVTLIAQKPRIGPYREEMRQRIAHLLDLPIDRISVKATTTDHLGFTGRGEGIAAQAIVTIEQRI